MLHEFQISNRAGSVVAKLERVGIIAFYKNRLERMKGFPGSESGFGTFAYQ
jgi:hypothetical protein